MSVGGALMENRMEKLRVTTRSSNPTMGHISGKDETVT